MHKPDAAKRLSSAPPPTVAPADTRIRVIDTEEETPTEDETEEEAAERQRKTERLRKEEEQERKAEERRKEFQRQQEQHALASPPCIHLAPKL